MAVNRRSDWRFTEMDVGVGVEIVPHPAGPQELAALEPRFGANLEGLAGKERGKGIQAALLKGLGLR